jgi:hypothetical protein
MKREWHALVHGIPMATHSSPPQAQTTIQASMNHRHNGEKFSENSVIEPRTMPCISSFSPDRLYGLSTGRESRTWRI